MQHLGRHKYFHCWVAKESKIVRVASGEKTVLEIYNPILVQEQQKEKTENILSKKVGQQTEGP